jgi:hypothetical protein
MDWLEIRILKIFIFVKNTSASVNPVEKCRLKDEILKLQT